ncbi:MAG: hypothetical protein U9R37_02285 [Campylobacterota bacterium]|nr:hypothetical protein [Campylobacterota bacterium]
MKLFYFSVTKHQYKYFNKLKDNLPFDSIHKFFPNLSVSIDGFLYFKNIDVKDIYELKFKEIDKKYKSVIKKTLYKSFLKLQAPWVVSVTYKTIKSYNPDFVVLWNGKKFHQAIVEKVSKSLDKRCIYFENGVLPDTTTIDFVGVNATASISREYSFYKNLNFTDKETLSKNIISRVSKNKAKNSVVKLPDNYIFVPFQVGYDSQIMSHSPWIEDMYEFFEIVEYLSKKIDLKFVIKEHPSDRVNDYSSLYKRVNDNIFFTSQNTQMLIEKSSAVLTINSSVAIESLLFHKKVIVLGEAFFTIDGIVKIANNKNEILNILKDIDNFEPDIKTIDNFLKYLKYNYLVPKSWREPNKEHFDIIESKIKDRISNG